jgi:hypothetical protein
VQKKNIYTFYDQLKELINEKINKEIVSFRKCCTVRHALRIAYGFQIRPDLRPASRFHLHSPAVRVHFGMRRPEVTLALVAPVRLGRCCLHPNNLRQRLQSDTCEPSLVSRILNGFETIQTDW